MKKYLILLILLTWASMVQAGSLMVVGGSVPASAPAYTEELFYNGDYPSHTDYAEVAHRTSTLAGTFTGADVVAGGTTPGTASPDGANCIRFDVWNETVTFPLTAGDVASSSLGYASFYVYSDNAVGTQTTLFQIYRGSGDRITVLLMADGTVRLYHFGNGDGDLIASTATLSDDAWTLISVRWDTTTNVMGVKVGEAAWVDKTSASITPFATADTGTIRMNDDGNNVTWYIDKIQIWTTYDAT